MAKAKRAPKRSPEREAIDEGIKKAGGIVEAAAKFGVTISAITAWRRLGLSRLRAIHFEEVTGVARWRTCPKHYPPPHR